VSIGVAEWQYMQQMASNRSRNRQTDPKERWSAGLQEAEYLIVLGGSLVSYTYHR
jgi:hypothetical protein